MQIHSARDGEHAIVAEPGSSLRVENCSIGPGPSGRRFLFYVEKARFAFTRNELRGAGLGMFTEGRSLGLALIGTEGAVIEGNVIYHEKASGIALEHARYTKVADNRIVHLGEGAFGIHLASSSDNVIAHNTLIGQNEAIPVQPHSFNNRVIGNSIRDSVMGIFVRHGAGNNLVAGNTIVAEQKPTFWALAVDKTASPNVFVSNIVRGARAGLLASYASRLVAANNLLADFAPAQAPGNLGAIHLFRCSFSELLNNRIERSRDGGIALVFSSDNRVAGNQVTDSKHGIALFYESDHNRLEGNLLARNGVNLILEKAVENVVRGKHIESGGAPDYDRGGNIWSRNFWRDYQSQDRGDGMGREARRIPPAGADPEPLMQAPRLEPVPVPGWSPLPRLPAEHAGRGHWQLQDDVLCEGRTMEYVGGWLVIGPGSRLTLRNCTLLASSHWADEPVIWVMTGGSLSIRGSLVTGRERDVPLSITVEPGGRLEVRDSVFKNLGWAPGVEHGLRIRGDEAVTENNRFEGCFACTRSRGDGTTGLSGIGSRGRNSASWCRRGFKPPRSRATESPIRWTVSIQSVRRPVRSRCCRRSGRWSMRLPCERGP
ncbi:MAG: right-handed parallel beta-helix repeat-containing protein [Bryobacterales bacterium]|nr:right-handed parallel beta-helix repeat-containing protein [Bryobacteraceae bacterium]MDW8130212.1 right-handed parallel beta-helix repeat-containing protein [Bryobacterales bacterium]